MIGILKEPNTITNGIYPVFLLFKSVNKLVLSYGVSETTDSGNQWSNTHELTTINDWYVNEFNEKSVRYGDSFVKSVYDLGEELSADQIQKDLDEILSVYKQQIFTTPQVVKEGLEGYGKDDRKYWLIAPGDSASEWDRFYKKGIVGVGWDAISDLMKYDEQKILRQDMKKSYPENKSHKNNSLAMWEFSHVMKPGDIVITKKGLKNYLGFGIVSSEYYYDIKGGEYPHLRKIDWKKNGEWPEEVHQIVQKTLTDITKYPEYVDRLKRLIGRGKD